MEIVAHTVYALTVEPAALHSHDIPKQWMAHFVSTSSVLALSPFPPASRKIPVDVEPIEVISNHIRTPHTVAFLEFQLYSGPALLWMAHHHLMGTWTGTPS